MIPALAHALGMPDAAFALPGNDNTQALVATTTTARSSNQNSATERTSPTTEIETPTDDSSMPGQLDKARGKSRGHDDHKDGN